MTVAATASRRRETDGGELVLNALGYVADGSVRVDLTPLTPTIQKLQTLERGMNARLIEREEPVRAAICALLCAQHTVLIGPPGTAKSKLIVLLAEALHLKRFVTLISKTMPLEELVGPVSVAGLQHDQYRRITTARMPEAQIVLLDEVFNGSDAVLNGTLTMMNERAFDNGGARGATPLISLFGATNHLPQSPNLVALWDRFQFRIVVDYVSKANHPRLLADALSEPSSGLLGVLNNQGIAVPTIIQAPIPVSITAHDLFAAMYALAHLPVPAGVVDALGKLYGELDAMGVKISDRRWVQALDALRAHALLEGRGIVTADDLAVLQHCFWNTPEQRAKIAQLIQKLGNPLLVRALEIADQATSAYDKVAALKGQDSWTTEATKAVAQLKEAFGKLKRLRGDCVTQGYSTEKIDRLQAKLRAQHDELATAVVSLDITGA